MKLYHGSPSIVGRPEYGKGSLKNDYGRGFYCTEDIELAKEWACQHGQDGFANIYELDTTGLQVLDLGGPEYNILNWLAVLARHRSYWEKSSISEEAKVYLQEYFLPDTSWADVIRGYRADDSYFTFAKNFVANGLSLEQLRKAMYLGNLGEQVVLISKKAFRQIEPIRAIPVSAEIYADKAYQRDKSARRAYREIVRKESFADGLYMLDIMRRGLKNEDIPK